MYGHRCLFCDGLVRETVVDREPFKHARGFVILERVPVGICDTCGNRYYHASVLRRVEAVATGAAPGDRTEPVPVAAYAYHAPPAAR